MFAPLPNPIPLLKQLWLKQLQSSNFFLSFFDKSFFSMLEKTLGPAAAELLRQILSFVMGDVKWTRLQMRKAWAWLQTRIMSIKTVYKFPSPDACVRETTSYFVSEEGNILENVTTEQLAWEDIPADVRAEQIKHKEEKVVVDVKEHLEIEFKERVKKQEKVSDKEVLEILA